MDGCKNIIVRNNEIGSMKLLYSRANIYESNKFPPSLLNDLDKNLYEQAITNYLKCFWSFISCFSVILIYMSYVGQYIYAIPIALMIVMFLFIIRMFKKKQKATEGLPPNEFIENKILEKPDDLAKDIFTKYNWFK